MEAKIHSLRHPYAAQLLARMLRKRTVPKRRTQSAPKISDTTAARSSVQQQPKEMSDE